MRCYLTNNSSDCNIIFDPNIGFVPNNYNSSIATLYRWHGGIPILYGEVSYYKLYNGYTILPDALTSCKDMFRYCGHFNKPVNIPDGVTHFNNMFCNCYRFNQPVTIPHGALHCSSMFEECVSFNQPVTVPNTVISCDKMFCNCTNLLIDNINCDFESVTGNINYMCHNILINTSMDFDMSNSSITTACTPFDVTVDSYNSPSNLLDVYVNLTFPNSLTNIGDCIGSISTHYPHIYVICHANIVIPGNVFHTRFGNGSDSQYLFYVFDGVLCGDIYVNQFNSWSQKGSIVEGADADTRWISNNTYAGIGNANIFKTGTTIIPHQLNVHSSSPMENLFGYEYSKGVQPVVQNAIFTYTVDALGNNYQNVLNQYGPYYDYGRHGLTCYSDNHLRQWLMSGKQENGIGYIAFNMIYDVQLLPY